MTAERTYREKTLTDICHAYKLVAQAGKKASDEPQACTSRDAEACTAQEGDRREDNRRLQVDETDQEEDGSEQEQTSEPDEMWTTSFLKINSTLGWRFHSRWSIFIPKTFYIKMSNQSMYILLNKKIKKPFSQTGEWQTLEAQ
ncbi:uncharacterized protein [Phyllobates terribilis]|uniref:uncharacterized protein isoform X2 n=1 Tax=Phyllobates terribilis TaxID=111132 RepID=UPI003CCB62A4